MEKATEIQPERHVKCERCGGYMVYSLETNRLQCRYCGYERELTVDETPIDSHDYPSCRAEDEQQQFDHLDALTEQQVACPQCGAHVTFDTGTYAKNCDFCGSPLQLAPSQVQRHWKVDGLLPFALDKQGAAKAFRKWIHRAWLSPERLRRMGTDFDHFKGYYVPFWVYDVETITDYDVQYQDNRIFKKKGKFYVFNLDNKMHKTGRWEEYLENVVVPAHMHFDNPVVLKEQDQWDFENLVPFSVDYLRGYVTELYTSTFVESRQMANEKIESIIKKHIPGPGAGSITYNRFKLTQPQSRFKLVLLPLWISSYRYGNDVCPIVVNARTGKVSGTIPVSWWKLIFLFIGIALFALFCINIEFIYNYFFG